MSMEESNLCIVCNKEKEEGIRICSQWVCLDCESEIVRTDVQDVKYSFFIHRLRLIGVQNMHD